MNRPSITKCKVEGCNLKHYSNEYCQYHFFEAQKKGYIKQRKQPVNTTEKKKCKVCEYFQAMIGTQKGCAYATITGELRGCIPEKCNKFKPKSNSGSKSNEDIL
ncbi:MAG: hypothetical protein RSC30_07445 [Oscillospiraceae bacterium]